MDEWQQCLFATRELFLEDDEEDDFNVHWVMGLKLRAQPHAIPSHRHEMHVRMMSNYFGDEHVFGPNVFRRRYCMGRSLFMTILDRVVQETNTFFRNHVHVVI